jgi:NAD(P)-dependent dehydrogenase (short-subunit alcohol dehydrogenase family)
MFTIKELNNTSSKKINKYGIITGGCGRIGSVFTTVLLSKGYKIIVASRTNASFKKYKLTLSKHLRKYICWHYLDLEKFSSIDRFCEKIIKKNQNLFYIINNAANSLRGKNIKYSKSKITKEFKGVSLGSIYLTEKILPLLRKNNEGKVIFTGSIWQKKIPNFQTYLDMDIGPSLVTASAKASLIQYAKYIAVREADKNIQVNTLVPGWFPRKGPVERKDYINKILHNIPMSRIGNLKDLVKPIEFLLSEENDYMTGQSLIIDGGYSLY